MDTLKRHLVITGISTPDTGLLLVHKRRHTSRRTKRLHLVKKRLLLRFRDISRADASLVRQDTLIHGLPHILLHRPTEERHHIVMLELIRRDEVPRERADKRYATRILARRRHRVKAIPRANEGIQLLRPLRRITRRPEG